MASLSYVTTCFTLDYITKSGIGEPTRGLFLQWCIKHNHCIPVVIFHQFDLLMQFSKVVAVIGTSVAKTEAICGCR